MTTSPNRHGTNAARQSAGTCARRRVPPASGGTPRDLLRRHTRDAEQAVRDPVQLALLLPELLGRTADPRNLFCAFDHLAHHGGQSPGIDGMCYEDLDPSDVWQMCRTLGKTILTGTYRPDRDRRKTIPKASGTGTRMLSIPTIRDRVVQRAIVQTIQTILDAGFDDGSYGFRPGRNRTQALTLAETLAQVQRRWVWVPVDLKDAFDHVPLRRLQEALLQALPREDMVQLTIQTATRRGTQKGLRQGGGLSPLLLNVYLDHYLDSRWRNLGHDIPMIRYGDDILLLCQSSGEAKTAHRLLLGMIREMGMKAKDRSTSCIKDLRNQERTEWLGYSIGASDNHLDIDVRERSWTRLETNLGNCHSGFDAPTRAVKSIIGWIKQIGPAFKGDDRDRTTIARIVEIANRLAFDEIPPQQELWTLWEGAHQRWLAQRRRTREGIVGGGSACQEPNGADMGPTGGAPARGAPSGSSSSMATLTLFTGSFGTLGPEKGPGGWAYLLRDDDTRRCQEAADMSPSTTNGRMALLAILRALERTPRNSRVRIVTSSAYIAGQLQLRPQGELVLEESSLTSPSTLDHPDLWQRLNDALRGRIVSWTTGGADLECPEMETCRRLAWQAATRSPADQTAQAAPLAEAAP